MLNIDPTTINTNPQHSPVVEHVPYVPTEPRPSPWEMVDVLSPRGVDTHGEAAGRGHTVHEVEEMDTLLHQSVPCVPLPMCEEETTHEET